MSKELKLRIKAVAKKWTRSRRRNQRDFQTYREKIITGQEIERRDKVYERLALYSIYVSECRNEYRERNNQLQENDEFFRYKSSFIKHKSIAKQFACDIKEAFLGWKRNSPCKIRACLIYAKNIRNGVHPIILFNDYVTISLKIKYLVDEREDNKRKNEKLAYIGMHVKCNMHLYIKFLLL